MRYRFEDLFTINPDGSITPRTVIQIGGITMSPGVTFGSGVSFSGVDIHRFKGCDIEADKKGKVIQIKGFYQ